MKMCNNCQAQVKDDARFCHLCGAELSEEKAVAAEDENVYSQYAKREISYDESDFSTNKIVVSEITAEEKQCDEKEEVKTQAQQDKEKEQKCLDELYKKQKWEVLAWTLTGIIPALQTLTFTFCGIVFLLIGFMFMNMPAEVGVDSYSDSNGTYDYYYDDFYGDYYNDIYGDIYGGNSYQTEDAELFGFAGIVYFIGGGVYFTCALVFLAQAIFFLVYGLNINKKRKKIYTDCTQAVAHSNSAWPLVIAALTNKIVFVFVIISYICVANNKETFERIKEVQAEYNKQ